VGDYSCDVDYEQTLFHLGFRSNSTSFFNPKISSISKVSLNKRGTRARTELGAVQRCFRSVLLPHSPVLLILFCTQGCANEVLPLFHVVTESERRPRLQCAFCFDLGMSVLPTPSTLVCLSSTPPWSHTTNLSDISSPLLLCSPLS